MASRKPKPPAEYVRPRVATECEECKVVGIAGEDVFPFSLEAKKDPVWLHRPCLVKRRGW